MLDQLLLFFLLLLALLVRFLLSLMADPQQAREQDGLPRDEPAQLLFPPTPPSVPLLLLPEASSTAATIHTVPSTHEASIAVPYRHRWLQGLRRHEARQGIVLMTILGPCRALEPAQPPQ
jgi:hypothetical protein